MPDAIADALDQTIANAEQKLEEKTKADTPKPAPPAPAGQALPGATPAPDAGVSVELTEEAIGDLYSTAFGLLATRNGEHWELQEYERSQLTKATKTVLDKYAMRVSPESMLVFWLGMTIAPRLYLSSKKTAPIPSKEIPKPSSLDAIPPAPAPKPKPKAPENTGWSADDKDN